MLVSQAAEETLSWLPDVSNGELIGFLLWVVAEFALALAAMLVIVHRAVALPKGHQLQTHFLAGWGATNSPPRSNPSP